MFVETHSVETLVDSRSAETSVETHFENTLIEISVEAHFIETIVDLPDPTGRQISFV